MALLTRVRGPLARLAPVAAVLAVMSAASSVPSGANLPSLRSISSRLDGGMSTVLIESTEPVAYLTSQPDPLTVLVDLRNVTIDSTGARRLSEPQAPVNAVEVAPSQSPDGAPMARVRVQLDRAARHRVRSSRNMIFVEVDRSGAPAPALRLVPATAAVAPKAPMIEARRSVAAAATEITAVKASAATGGMAVTLSGNGRLVATRVEEAKDLPPRVLLDFEGVAMGRVPAATTVNQGDVERVRVAVNSRTPLITRVVIDLAKKLPYTVESVGEELRVLFTRAVDAAAAAVAPATPARQPASDPPGPPAIEVPAPPPAAVPAAAPAPSASSMAAMLGAGAPPAAQVTAAQPAAPPPPDQPVFSGHNVTLDFQGADLRAVLRTFAEISSLNVVIDPSINGTVDVSLREVPWDQALDVILKANKLGYMLDGTIVRIAPLTVLAQENEERRKLAETRANAGELRIMTRALSYAKAADLVPIITRSSLSPRGDVQIDSRTNTLIIRDLADRLEAANDLLGSLDKPQPQVEIEARIVQTNRDFARSVGVQWGFNGRVDPALGTGTGLAFPSSGAGVGAVNLPAVGPTSAVGIVLGSVNGAFNLDVALTAMETSGKGRLLSTPRVTTQNNIQAEVTQGTQIPYQTVANNTVTVSFKDAALKLLVTPQITASNTVIMRIELENATPDFQNAIVTPTGAIPPIATQRALTTVLVADGDTTVIGGIYTSNETTVEGRTPVLHRIPLLGWLFKQNDTQDESRELLIFITPRITKA
jgi:type IV pilus assembly protein PilQ